MSAFKYPRFIKEFAYRTMINYLNLKNMDHSKEPIPEVQSILNEMKDNGFDDFSQEYEVSLAINSIMGLLIFPQQEYYDLIKDEESFDQLSELKRCIDIDTKYKYDYYILQDNEIIKENQVPSNVLRHMRNAASHKRISLIPKSSSSGKDITHIEFQDKSYINMNDNKKKYCCEFDLHIDVNSLEKVLFEIARYLINHEV